MNLQSTSNCTFGYLTDCGRGAWYVQIVSLVRALTSMTHFLWLTDSLFCGPRICKPVKHFAVLGYLLTLYPLMLTTLSNIGKGLILKGLPWEERLILEGLLWEGWQRSPKGWVNKQSKTVTRTWEILQIGWNHSELVIPLCFNINHHSCFCLFGIALIQYRRFNGRVFSCMVVKQEKEILK